jgi:Fic family protein
VLLGAISNVKSHRDNGLRKTDFSSSAPGQLLTQTAIHGEFLAYVPDPLPPHLHFDLGMVNLLAEATLALGELRGVGQMLPNPHLLIEPFVRREAVSSSRIEGTITDLRQLLLFEADMSAERSDDSQEVVNYIAALSYGLDRLKTLPVSLRLLREVHEHLMTGVRGEEKMPGEFRNRQNMIGRLGQTPKEARFVPPPLGQMREALGALEKYMAGPSRLPVLVDLALIHYQFETIHPFLDGNGRLGRLLISLLLCERQLLTQPLLYLSSYLEQNRDEYMDLLLAVSQQGRWTDWVEFFLKGVGRQSKLAIERASELLELRDHYRNRVQSATKSSSAVRLVDMLFEQPAVTVNRVAAKLDLTFRAANANVERFVEHGILEEVTGKERNRVYIAMEIVRAIQKDEAVGPEIK